MRKSLFWNWTQTTTATGWLRLKFAKADLCQTATATTKGQWLARLFEICTSTGRLANAADVRKLTVVNHQAF